MCMHGCVCVHTGICMGTRSITENWIDFMEDLTVKTMTNSQNCDEDSA